MPVLLNGTVLSVSMVQTLLLQFKRKQFKFGVCACVRVGSRAAKTDGKSLGTRPPSPWPSILSLALLLSLFFLSL